MKKIALIHDLSSFGKCSLTAAIPVISALGIQACPLPTAILSSQTGFSSYFYDDYTDKMDLFTNEWKKMDISFDGIYSGYLGSYEQINKVLYFLDNFKTIDNLYIADPVMGDNGKRINIFSDKLLSGMKELCFKSDICTPNLTELCLITNISYEELIAHSSNEDYITRISDLVYSKVRYNDSKNHTIIVTGIIQTKKDTRTIGNLIIETQNNTPLFYESLYTGRSFSGTGDLFTSVICGALVNGMSTSDAVNLAITFLKPAIDDATLQNISSNHGVNFEKYLKILMK